jgi:hypothetical protein
MNTSIQKNDREFGKELTKLLSLSSPELCRSEPSSDSLLGKHGSAVKDLLKLLNRRNGFYAFGAALHVLPSSCASAQMDLERWNAQSLWRHLYGERTNGLLFFAEDVFGVQFSIQAGAVYKFDPETGESEIIAANLEGWATVIIDDPEYQTGYPLLNQWEQHHGLLSQGKRLLPKIPFVLGGQYNINNLYSLDAVTGMRLRADTWKQIKDLPDGSEIRLKVINKPT